MDRELICLDTETLAIPDKLSEVVTQNELNSLGLDFYDELDLLVELAFVHQKGSDINFYSDLCKPPLPITDFVSSKNNITNDMIGYDSNILGKTIKLPDSKNTKSYKTLKKLLKQDNAIFISHNTEFDIDILNRAGLNLDKVDIIDTLQVCKHLYQSKAYTNKPIESVALQYLKVHTKINKALDNVDLIRGNKKLATEFSKLLTYEDYINKNNIKDVAHRALSDALTTQVLLDYLMDEFDLSLDKMIELTKEDVLLTNVPYTGDRGKLFTSLEDSNLMWFYNESNDRNIEYTTSTILKERGIDLYESYINFGKFKGKALNDKTITSDYMLWIYHNYNNMTDNLETGIVRELLDRGMNHPSSYEQTGRNWTLIDFNNKITKAIVNNDSDAIISLIDDNRVNDEDTLNDILQKCEANKFNDFVTKSLLTNLNSLDYIIKYKDDSYCSKILTNNINYLEDNFRLLKKKVNRSKTPKEKYENMIDFKNYKIIMDELKNDSQKNKDIEV